MAHGTAWGQASFVAWSSTARERSRDRSVGTVTRPLNGWEIGGKVQDLDDVKSARGGNAVFVTLMVLAANVVQSSAQTFTFAEESRCNFFMVYLVGMYIYILNIK